MFAEWALARIGYCRKRNSVGLLARACPSVAGQSTWPSSLSPSTHVVALARSSLPLSSSSCPRRSLPACRAVRSAPPSCRRSSASSCGRMAREHAPACADTLNYGNGLHSHAHAFAACVGRANFCGALVAQLSVILNAYHNVCRARRLKLRYYTLSGGGYVMKTWSLAALDRSEVCVIVYSSI